MSFQQFEFADHDAEFSDVTRGEWGFCETVGKRTWLTDFVAEELPEAVAKQQEALRALVSEGKFPKTFEPDLPTGPKFAQQPLTEEHVKASVQVFTAHVLSRFGDSLGEDAMVFYLVQANPQYRRIALYDLQYSRDERFSPLTVPILQALKTCICHSEEDALLTAGVAETLRLKQLIPEILEARQRVSADAAKSLTKNLVCLTSDRKLTDEWMTAVLPQLGRQELWPWVQRLAAEVSRNWSHNGPERLRPWARRLLERWQEETSDEEAIECLQKHSYSWKHILDAKDQPFLERIVAHEAANLDGSSRRLAEEFLARLDPERRLQYLLETEFETLCRQIAGTVQPGEVDRLTKQAAKAARQKGSRNIEGSRPIEESRPFEEFSVRVLWNECGRAGQTLLLKKLDACSTIGLRTILWFAEGLTAEAAADALVANQLSHLPTAELLKNLHDLTTGEDEHNRQGPLAPLFLLHPLNRRHTEPSDSDRYPPTYPTLLASLAQASAGVLKITDATVGPADDQTIEPIPVQFECNGRACQFSADNWHTYFDKDSVHRAVNTILESLAIPDRFHQVIADSIWYFDFIFGRPEAITSYADRFAIPLHPLGVPCADANEESFRQSCILRIKSATKRSKRPAKS